MNKFEEIVKKNSNDDETIQNLKITIKNDTEEDEEEEQDESMDVIETEINDENEQDETEFHVNLDKAPPTLQNTILNEKIYLNESFDKPIESKIDIDLDFISEPNLALLYDSLNLNESNFVEKDTEYDVKNANLYRKDALHVYGVDNLKTDEIFDFFGIFKPFAIEWINDSSCNLVWKNEIHAVNALLHMTSPYDSACLIDKKQRLPPQGNKWRKSINLVKGKFQLYMRFVRVKTDRKIKGAESRSKFYVKNGNPNYGNIRGLISASKRKELKAKQLDHATSDLDLDQEDTSNGRKLVSYEDVLDDVEEQKVSSKVEKKSRGMYSDEINSDSQRKKTRFEPYSKSRTKSIQSDPNDLRNKLNRIKRLSSNY